MKKIIASILKRFPKAIKMFAWRLLSLPRLRMRAKFIYLLSPRQMDSDLLCAEIRRMAHAANRLASGREKEYVSGKLAAALDEWRRRGNDFSSSEDMAWALEVSVKTSAPSLRGNIADDHERLTDYVSIAALIRGRRSVRRFTAEPVSADDIAKIVEAGRWAPSSCNRQAWKIAVAGGVSPSRIYVAIDERPYPEKYAAALDAAAMVQNMLLAARALGLGTCWTYQGDSVDQKKLLRRLGLASYYYVYSMVLVGRPDERPAAPPRKTVKDNLIYLSTESEK